MAGAELLAQTRCDVWPCAFVVERGVSLCSSIDTRLVSNCGGHAHRLGYKLDDILYEVVKGDCGSQREKCCSQ